MRNLITPTFKPAPVPYDDDFNILILGHKEHGKTTLAKVLQEEFDFTYLESSFFMRHNVRAYMSKQGIKDYPNAEACFNDRGNHREIWFKVIAEFNREHGNSQLGKELFEKANVYCGMRSNVEFRQCFQDRLFNIIFWIDAGDRKELEPRTSFNIPFEPNLMFKIYNQYETKSTKHLGDQVELILDYYAKK